VNIENYYIDSTGTLSFTQQAASEFAKLVAGDFNPIHDPGSRRFCVPGDLLFAVVLHQQSARSKMTFSFLNMVDDQVELSVVKEAQSLSLVAGHQSDSSKHYLDVTLSDDKVISDEANQSLIASYVQFSGQTFPYLLVDLMQEHKVMINPKRPLVIYKSMALDLADLKSAEYQLEFAKSSLQKNGNKAVVHLNFDIIGDNGKAGSGSKEMLLGGLRDYDQAVIDALVDEYNAIKNSYSV